MVWRRAWNNIRSRPHSGILSRISCDIPEVLVRFWYILNIFLEYGSRGHVKCKRTGHWNPIHVGQTIDFSHVVLSLAVVNTWNVTNNKLLNIMLCENLSADYFWELIFRRNKSFFTVVIVNATKKDKIHNIKIAFVFWSFQQV